MDRYDWEWGRSFSGPRGAPYDRAYRSGNGWWGRLYRGGGKEGRYGAFGGYDFDRGRWAPPAGGGHRFAYPGARSGGRGPHGRQEPWEPGPPGGFGSQWGRAYGGQARPGGRRFRYDRYPSEYEGFGPGAPPPFDAYDLGQYYDDEPDSGFGGPWEYEEMDDDAVRDSVWRSLRSDGFVDAEAIQIEVRDRVVTLRGEVQDYMEARYAWDDAWEAEGVRGVVSKLTVQAAGRMESPPGSARKATANGGGEETGKRSKGGESQSRS